MPSTMIHLLTAYHADPQAPGLYWLGSFAPDYVNERQLKDEIHLRVAADRRAALAELKNSIDKASPFDMGWLLHLYTDACWDESEYTRFKARHEADGEGADWFRLYRRETGDASYRLYHDMPWSKDVWALIMAVRPHSVITALPITGEQATAYRDRVAQRHSENCPDSYPAAFSRARLESFARDTAAAFAAWMRRTP